MKSHHLTEHLTSCHSIAQRLVSRVQKQYLKTSFDFCWFLRITENPLSSHFRSRFRIHKYRQGSAILQHFLTLPRVSLKIHLSASGLYGSILRCNGITFNTKNIRLQVCLGIYLQGISSKFVLISHL